MRSLFAQYEIQRKNRIEKEKNEMMIEPIRYFNHTRLKYFIGSYENSSYADTLKHVKEFKRVKIEFPEITVNAIFMVYIEELNLWIQVPLSANTVLVKKFPSDYDLRFLVVDLKRNKIKYTITEVNKNRTFVSIDELEKIEFKELAKVLEKL